MNILSSIRGSRRGRSGQHAVTAGLVGALLLGSVGPAGAGVVINEIFYHAPDDVDDLQWIELHNTDSQAADLSGWTLDDGKLFTFQPGTRLAAGSFLVVALNTNRFTQFYHTGAFGPLKRPLKHGGEKLQLKDAAGKLADGVRYKDRAPWPASPDGYSASLERICPGADGESAGNWAASPLPATPKPAGSPGQPNTRLARALPPAVSLDPGPAEAAPGQALPVTATVPGSARSVELVYSVVTAKGEQAAQSVPMTRAAGEQCRAEIPPQAAGSLIRYRVKATAADGAFRFSPDENDLRPTASTYVHEPWEKALVPYALILSGSAGRNTPGFRTSARVPRGMGRGPAPNFAGFQGDRQDAPRPPRGASTLVYVDPQNGVTTVFDYVNIVPRGSERGYKVFFHKDRKLDGLGSVSIEYEGSEWSLLAEAMAYDLYHRAGCPAPQAEFVRLWVDGRLLGHHLMIERINRAFLKRNEIDDTGNLYKLLWMRDGVIEQHEKRTHEKSGHSDLLKALGQIAKTKTNALQQWEAIKANFDVDEVAGYFAVNMVLSHWDGYFNNYFTYHDTKLGKWQMYPWDQDKTWGYYDGLPDNQVFYDLPLSFGMEGDRSGGGGGFGGGGPFGGGQVWWRPAGHFSGPLLANPEFRKRYLARINQILQDIYTPTIYDPLLDALATRLEADALIRAKLRGQSPEEGKRLLARDVNLLKTHLVKRREFLLAQPELKRNPAPRDPGEQREPKRN